jgi:hypothetical protein
VDVITLKEITPLTGDMVRKRIPGYYDVQLQFLNTDFLEIFFATNLDKGGQIEYVSLICGNVRLSGREGKESKLGSLPFVNAVCGHDPRRCLTCSRRQGFPSNES